jgi:hypothetical protein
MYTVSRNSPEPGCDLNKSAITARQLSPIVLSWLRDQEEARGCFKRAAGVSKSAH